MHTEKPEVTTAIILEKRVTRKTDKRHPVKLRVTYQRDRKYYTIKGKAFTQTEFSNIMYPDSRGKNKEIRKTLEAIENRARKIIDEVLDEFSFELFEKEYLTHKKKDKTLKGYFDEKQAELKAENKVKSESLYKTTYKALENWDSNISFAKITPANLRKFENWMLEKGKSYTTIGIYIRNLRHIVNRAMKDGVKKQYPFGKESDKYSIPQSRTKKRALTIEEIELLFTYKPKNQKQRKALSYWIFSYLCNGMNIADIARLKYKNIEGETFSFIREKTRNTSGQKPIVTVYLWPKALEIIEEIGNLNKDPENYIFPILDKGLTENQIHDRIHDHIREMNKSMADIANELKIDKKITTYSARHSFGTILRLSGAPFDFIGEAFGHQTLKNRVTSNYLEPFGIEQYKQYTSVLIPEINKN